MIQVPYADKHPQNGIALLDAVMGLAVTAGCAVMVMAFFVHMVSVFSLSGTANILVNRLRDLQALAQTDSIYTQARLAPYNPAYSTYQGTTVLARYSFFTGVSYYQGYLHMTSGNFLYDILGNGQMAGTVQLVNGQLEQDIHLYMGTGYQWLGGTFLEPH